MPEISVIIPAYNAEHTIRETIESVQQQTFPDFEIIVINDGSTDRTLEVVQSIQDERIKIFSYENGGLPTARNRGIYRAKGEFIAFLDADDLWTPDKLELQLAALKQHPEAGVAYSWTVCMLEQGETLSFRQVNPTSFEGNIYPKLLLGNFIGHGSNVLIRKQAIESVGGFDPALKSCEDWDYWLRLSARWPFVVVPKNQILYRRTFGSMSSSVEVMEEQGLFMIEKAYREATSEFQHLNSQSLSNFYRYCAELYLEYRYDRGGVKQAQHKLWSAIHLNPKTLLEKTTQKLLLKFFLIRIFTPRYVGYLLQLNRKTFAIRDPRLKTGAEDFIKA